MRWCGRARASILRDQKVAEVVDLLAQMTAELERRGVRFLVAVAAEFLDHLSGRSCRLGAERRPDDRIRPAPS